MAYRWRILKTCGGAAQVPKIDPATGTTLLARTSYSTESSIYIGAVLVSKWRIPVKTCSKLHHCLNLITGVVVVVLSILVCLCKADPASPGRYIVVECGIIGTHEHITQNYRCGYFIRRLRGDSSDATIAWSLNNIVLWG